MKDTIHLRFMLIVLRYIVGGQIHPALKLEARNLAAAVESRLEFGKPLFIPKNQASRRNTILVKVKENISKNICLLDDEAIEAIKVKYGFGSQFLHTLRHDMELLTEAISENDT